METLRLKVQEIGATVVHIKTDSIKIADPTPEVERFILEYGKQWGYNFEIESIYDRICLVNDAVYIAKCSDAPENGDEAGHWTATGAQFQHPYVFKTLFSKEKVEFRDLCETRTVKTDMYLDMNEAKPSVEAKEKEFDKIDKELKKLDKNGGDPVRIADLIRRKSELEKIIEGGHKYVFVGKAGSFCPISEGYGGGILLRKGSDGKYGAVSGTKGYRWMEAEKVKELKYDRYIDMKYFRELADVAIDTIRVYGNFEVFVSNDTFLNPPQMNPQLYGDPPWGAGTPCCSAEYSSCSDCPHFFDDQEYCCKLGYSISKDSIQTKGEN